MTNSKLGSKLTQELQYLISLGMSKEQAMTIIKGALKAL